jgi:hypothetical protein
MVISLYVYRVSQEESAIRREGVPYVKIYQYNPKHLCTKLNSYGDNGQYMELPEGYDIKGESTKVCKLQKGKFYQLIGDTLLKWKALKKKKCVY